jgi:hypothetical protein
VNRDEILKKPAGREMDALMWLLLNDKPLDLTICRYVDGDVQPHAGYPVGHISPENYSTDIALALQVVEKMREWEHLNTPLAICRAALLAVLKLDVPSPPCANCIYWHPRINLLFLSNGDIINDGAVLCHNNDMECDFSCYTPKGAE